MAAFHNFDFPKLLTKAASEHFPLYNSLFQFLKCVFFYQPIKEKCIFFLSDSSLSVLKNPFLHFPNVLLEWA